MVGRHGLSCWAPLALVVTLAHPDGALAQWTSDPALNLAVPRVAVPSTLAGIPDGAGGAIFPSFLSCGCNSLGAFAAQRIAADGQLAWGVEGVLLSDLVGMFGISGRSEIRAVPDGVGGSFHLYAISLVLGQGHQVFLQHLDASGGVRWPTPGTQLTAVPSAKMILAATSDGSGGGIVVWLDRPIGSPNTAFAQRFDGSGTALWAANGVPVPYGDPMTAVPDSSGGAILGYAIGDTGAASIGAARVDANGIVRWTTPVSTPIARDQVQMISDGNGGAVFAWHHGSYDPSGDILAQRVDAGGALRWLPDGVLVSGFPSEKSAPRLAPDATGGAIVVWQDLPIGPPRWTSYNILAQRVDGAGVKRWDAEGVGIVTLPADQLHPAVCTDSSGGAIVAWTDARNGTYDIYSQRLDAEGSHQWTHQGAPVSMAIGGQRWPQLVPRSVGEAIVIWNDSRSPEAYAQRVPISEAVATLGSLVSADAVPGQVRLRWHVSAPRVTDLALERRTRSGPWQPLAKVSADGAGYVAYEDDDVIAGEHYGYRLASSAPAVTFGETWVSVPLHAEFALEGPRPNPASGELYVSLSLASDDPAGLDLFDTRGRRIASRRWSPGAGRHVMNFGATSPLAPGLYFLRLTQGSQTTTARVTVLR